LGKGGSNPLRVKPGVSKRHSKWNSVTTVITALRRVFRIQLHADFLLALKTNGISAKVNIASLRTAVENLTYFWVISLCQ